MELQKHIDCQNSYSGEIVDSKCDTIRLVQPNYLDKQVHSLPKVSRRVMSKIKNRMKLVRISLQMIHTQLSGYMTGMLRSLFHNVFRLDNLFEPCCV